MHPKYQTAIHEAGHAVAAKLLGFRVESCSLREDFSTLGTCQFRPHDLCRSPKDRVAHLRNKTAVVLAGVEAECQILGIPCNNKNTPDEIDATADIATIVGLMASPEIADAEYAAAQNLAANIVREYREHIEEIAELLIEFDDAIERVETLAPENEAPI